MIKEATALDEASGYIESIVDFPVGEYCGRGITICGGGVRYFTNAWVCIRMLRHFGCDLPIQLWYLGPSEMDQQMEELVGPYGVEFELIEYDKAASMAPASVLDFCGNLTTFTYGEDWDFPSFLGGYILTQYSEPTAQNSPLISKTFKYLNSAPENPARWRVLVESTTDGTSLTEYALDTPAGSSEETEGLGRTVMETITKDTSQITRFTYGDATPHGFKGFVTRRLVESQAGDPDWATDLVTDFVPDAAGEIEKQIVDPGVGKLNLTTEYTYDANGNKLTAKDPEQHITSFTVTRRIDIVRDFRIVVVGFWADFHTVIVFWFQFDRTPRVGYDEVGSRPCSGSG